MQKKRLPLARAGNRWLGPVPKYLNTLGLGSPFSSPVRWHHGPVSMRTFLKQLFGTQLGNQTPFWQFGLILILIILIVEIKEKILKNIDCWKLLKYLDFVDLDISNYFVIKCRKMASKKSSHSGLIVLPPFWQYILTWSPSDHWNIFRFCFVALPFCASTDLVNHAEVKKFPLYRSL